MNATFQVGKIYQARFITDSNATINAKIIKRTEKTVKAEVEGEGVKSFRISMDSDNNEMFKPLGNYSMCPIIRASRKV